MTEKKNLVLICMLQSKYIYTIRKINKDGRNNFFMILLLVILLFKIIPQHCAKVLPGVLCSRSLRRALWSKYVSDSSVDSWITTLLAVSLISMSQQYTLKKVSLNRSTQKIKWCIDQLSKMLWPCLLLLSRFSHVRLCATL